MQPCTRIIHAVLRVCVTVSTMRRIGCSGGSNSDSLIGSRRVFPQRSSVYTRLRRSKTPTLRQHVGHGFISWVYHSIISGSMRLTCSITTCLKMEPVRMLYGSQRERASGSTACRGQCPGLTMGIAIGAGAGPRSRMTLCTSTLRFAASARGGLWPRMTMGTAIGAGAGRRSGIPVCPSSICHCVTVARDGTCMAWGHRGIRITFSDVNC